MMIKPVLSIHWLLWLIGSFWIDSVVLAEELFDETQAITLFAFDQATIPFSQNLKLEMLSPKKHPANPVVRRGPSGTPDAMGVQFYGSILREGDRYRMWYVAFDDDVDNPIASARWRAAYAESRDGIEWKKPNLGLVWYRGNSENNLIKTDPSPLGFVNLKVLADPDDPDPERRYKISSHVYFRHNTRLGSLAPFASSDGYRWKLLVDAQPEKAELKKSDLVLPAFHFEPCGGLYRWGNQFYVCGQNAIPALHPYHGRVVRMFRSPDFVHWSSTSSIGFVRPQQHTLLGAGRSLEGEQVHEGISVWNRNNLLVGIYGRWHGAKEWKDVTVDLGLVISNNGIDFREPVHEWTFLARGADGEWDQGGLLQGQGFENIGEETFVYYGAWDPRVRGEPRGGVGVAVLSRDRFGSLTVDPSTQGPGDYQLPEVTSELVTATLPTKPNRRYRLYANVDGLGPEAYLQFEWLSETEKPLALDAEQNAAFLRRNGFQIPVEWQAEGASLSLPNRPRLRVTFAGNDKVKIRLYALYLREID